MKIKNLALSGLLIATTAMPFSSLHAQDADKAGVTKSELGELIRGYLLENPEVILEAQVALEEKQEAQRKSAARQIITERAADLFHNPLDGVIGNPEGKLTIVEFFDYNCYYCKQALSDMEAVVRDDKDIRFVMKEFPILSEDSYKAHVVSTAFRHLQPEKYGDFHQKLLSLEEKATEDSAIQVALALGVAEADLRAEMAKPGIMESFRTTIDLARNLNITGTPAYIVGDEIISGAVGEEILLEKVRAARQQ